MDEIRKKYQRNNVKTEDKDKSPIKVNERRSNHVVVESKYEKPYSKKVVEQKVEIEQVPSNSRFVNMPKTTGRFSAIYSHKRDNNIYISTTPNERSKEKDIRQNEENTNYYSTKTTTNSSRPNYRRSVQDVKVEKEKPIWVKYEAPKEKEIPKEKITNYRPNSVYISKSVKEEKNENNPNIVSNTVTKSYVVQGRRN